MSQEPSGRPTIFRGAVAFESALAAVAVTIGWFIGQAPFEHIVWTGAALGWGVLACLPLLAAMWLAVRFPVRPLRSLMQITREQIVPLFTACTSAQIALITVAAGFGEELLFRGVVQEAISQKLASDGLGVLLAGTLFGLLHAITPTYAVLSGIVGMYLGWLFVVSQNLLVPITTHAVYDFGALVFLIHRHRAEATRPVDPAC